MNVNYQRATLEQLELLVQTRIEVLRAANLLDETVDMSAVEQTSRAYYREALSDGTHTGYLATIDGAFVGAGGVSYYRVMPTYHNPAGTKAYIMNMYVRPAYRRRGIATRLLELLVDDAHARGVSCITLEATDAGRPLYAKFGFVPMAYEMELP